MSSGVASLPLATFLFLLYPLLRSSSDSDWFQLSFPRKFSVFLFAVCLNWLPGLSFQVQFETQVRKIVKIVRNRARHIIPLQKGHVIWVTDLLLWSLFWFWLWGHQCARNANPTAGVKSNFSASSPLLEIPSRTLIIFGKISGISGFAWPLSCLLWNI